METLYGDLATWWPLLSPPEDYAEEATFFAQTLADAGARSSHTLLELGSGGGNNAVHLAKHFASLTLSDLSPQMLEISRALNPGCAHVAGDMRTLRLGRTFDVVFVHDAIDYMRTRDDLARALATAYAHCRPGGLALFAPDHFAETFEPSTEHGGRDDAHGRALRFLEWTYDTDPDDGLCTTEYILALREGDAPVRIAHETHVFGLFPRADWLALLRDAGFAPEIVPDPFDRELLLARRIAR
jgi:SAM-dependent methyltransferase